MSRWDYLKVVPWTVTAVATAADHSWPSCCWTFERILWWLAEVSFSCRRWCDPWQWRNVLSLSFRVSASIKTERLFVDSSFHWSNFQSDYAGTIYLANCIYECKIIFAENGRAHTILKLIGSQNSSLHFKTMYLLQECHVSARISILSKSQCKCQWAISYSDVSLPTLKLYNKNGTAL